MPTHLNVPKKRRSRKGSDPFPARSIYQTVTQRILDSLEQGVVPWRKPWRGLSSLPCNAISKRPYHGINLLLLSMAPFRDHRWLTFRQAGQLGGHVRPGERSSLAVFWKHLEIEEDGQHDTRRRSVPLLRYYHLFNVEQCGALDLPKLDHADRKDEHERIENAERLVRSMPNPPSIREGGNSAYYRPVDDVVQVPLIEAFLTSDAYYATLFHELGHNAAPRFMPRRLLRPIERTIVPARQIGIIRGFQGRRATRR